MSNNKKEYLAHLYERADHGDEELMADWVVWVFSGRRSDLLSEDECTRWHKRFMQWTSNEKVADHGR